MTRYAFALLLYIFSFAPLFVPLNVSAAPFQYENQIVGNISIECGNPLYNISASIIEPRMKTRVGAPFSQLDFDSDLKMLIQDYDKVEPTIECQDDQVQIALKIWQKPSIGSITWIGNERVSSSKLQKELNIKAGSSFDRQAFNQAFHALKTYYVKDGFFEAQLDYQINFCEDSNSVDITINIDEGRAGRIQRIVFENFAKEEEEAIVDLMLTKRFFALTSWYNNEGTYNEDMMQQDRFAIINYLQNEGYADATIEVALCESVRKNRIVVKIIANRGEVYSFGPITFEGNKLFTDKEIQAQINVLEGNSFSPDAIRNTIKRLTNFYGRKGYIDAVIDFETDLNPESNTYDVHFTIEEGEQYRVGLIKVFGNNSTETRVILHETLLIPGEIFNTLKLEVTESRLENIGYFKHVNVYAVHSEGPGGLGGHYRDVHIEVEETSTGNIKASVGISSAESAFLELGISERNFNHAGLGCFMSEGLRTLRGGGEYLNLNAMIGYKSRKYTLAWTKPFFQDTKWLVGFELTRATNRFIAQDYTINSSGLTLHAAYPLNPFLRFGTHYRLTYTDVEIHHKHVLKKEAKIQEQIELAKKAGDQEKVERLQRDYVGLREDLEKQAKNSGVISAIGLNLNYDSTDHPAFPRRGFKSKLEQEVAGFGGHRNFMSLGYLNKYFIPAGELGVLKFRADMRFVVPMFDTKRTRIPIEERLFLGGDSTIRGYKVYKLGPQFSRNDPMGGMSLQLLSAEYYRTINKKIDAFLFCDSGHLSFNVWDFGTMWTSVGFGLNLKLIEGTPPIVIGLGFPLNAPKKSVVKNFFFSFGGAF